MEWFQFGVEIYILLFFVALIAGLLMRLPEAADY